MCSNSDGPDNFYDTYQITHGAFGARKAPESNVSIRPLSQDTSVVILTVSSSANTNLGAAFLNWWFVTLKWVTAVPHFQEVPPF